MKTDLITPGRADDGAGDNAVTEIADLISRVALGDRQAFQQLYQRSSAKLFGICIRILGDSAEAEDALQDVFIKVWQHAASFQSSRASGITWLSAIARNQAIDRLRSRKSAGPRIEEADEVEDDSPSPEAIAVSSDGYRRLMGCMEKLDPRHAHAVKWTYLNGRSYQEAADELDIPLNTAKTWIRRSLLALRECLGQ
jgi:RNA polymerase sigma-70 factor (ECF subfamily)